MKDQGENITDFRMKKPGKSTGNLVMINKPIIPCKYIYHNDWLLLPYVVVSLDKKTLSL